MKLSNTDISITRGETFSIHYLLVNRNGAPYIISNQSNKPYFLLTISSTKYSQVGRYVKNWWLVIPEYLRFYTTNPVQIEKSYVTTNTAPEQIDNHDMSKYAVYYYIENNVKVYKRWTGSEYVNYELQIVKTFTKQDTSELLGQDYVYSINYVDGDDMLTYLRSLCDINDIEYSNTLTKKELYDLLCAYDAKYTDIQYERELGNITISVPIVNVSKLSVSDSIEGGII